MPVIQSVVLSDWFLIGVLIIFFAGVTRWALASRQAYTGYALGWFIGLFFIVAFSSLFPYSGNVIEDPAGGAGSLNFFQVMLAGFLGFAVSLFIIALSSIPQLPLLARSVQVAALTSVSVILIYLMFVSGTETRRMISLFALAFGITILTSQMIRIALNRSAKRQAVIEEELDNPPPENLPRDGLELNGRSRLDAIRENMTNR